MTNLKEIRQLRKNGLIHEAEEKLQEYHKEIKQLRKQDIINLKKEYFEELKANGICITCKKRKALNGTKCFHCAFIQAKAKDKSKPIYSYKSVGHDRFDVYKNGKLTYRVSLNPVHCDCKGFHSYHNCIHLKFILAQLEDKGGIFK